MTSEFLFILFGPVEESSAVSEVKDTLGLLNISRLTMVLSNTHIEVLIEGVPVLCISEAFCRKSLLIYGRTEVEPASFPLFAEGLSKT